MKQKTKKLVTMAIFFVMFTFAFSQSGISQNSYEDPPGGIIVPPPPPPPPPIK